MSASEFPREFLSYLNASGENYFSISEAIDRLKSETTGLDTADEKKASMQLLSEIGRKLQEPRFISSLQIEGIERLREISDQLRGTAAAHESKIERIFYFIIATADSAHAALTSRLDQALLDRFQVLLGNASARSLELQEQNDLVKLMPHCLDKLSFTDKQFYIGKFSSSQFLTFMEHQPDRLAFDAFKKAAIEVGAWERINKSK